jgi:hypothetical protein
MLKETKDVVEEAGIKLAASMYKTEDANNTGSNP